MTGMAPDIVTFLRAAFLSSPTSLVILLRVIPKAVLGGVVDAQDPDVQCHLFCQLTVWSLQSSVSKKWFLVLGFGAVRLGR